MRRSYGYLAAAAVALLVTPAEARVACNARDEVVKALDQQFAEVQVASGVTQGGQLMEVFASHEGTWTLILSLPTGQSCLIANGDEWDLDMEAAKKGPMGPREGISFESATPGHADERMP